MYNIPADVSAAALDRALDPDYLTEADLEEAYEDALLIDAAIEDKIRERINGFREWPPL